MNDLSLPSLAFSNPSPKPRVAVLVDGDNVPHSALPMIEATAATLGQPVIRRVFGDMTLHRDWAAETGFLTIHCTTTAGKNRADMQLTIGAMDMAHRGLADHFLILSDDRDFGPLVAHLREIGLQVTWTGKPKPVARPAAMLGDVDTRLHNLLVDAKGGLGLQVIGSRMKQGTVMQQTGKASWRAYIKSKDALYTLTGSGSASIVTLKSR